MINLFNLVYFVITSIDSVINSNVRLVINGNVLNVLIIDLKVIPEVYGELYIDMNSGLPYRFVLFRENKLKVSFNIIINIRDWIRFREVLGKEVWILEITGKDLEFRNYFDENVFRYMPINLGLDGKGYLENKVLNITTEGYLYV